MWKYLSGAMLIALLSAGAVVMHQRTTIAQQETKMSALVRERDNLKSELSVAAERLRQSQRAQMTTAEALSRAQEASRELASLKDWIKGNEDASIPDWFVDLLNHLGFGLRPGTAD